jgi:hypothetical protein
MSTAAPKTWRDEPVTIEYGFDYRLTSTLGKLIAEGSVEAVQARLQKPLDWNYEGTEALESAIRSGRFVEELIGANSPINGQVLYMLYRFEYKELFWRIFDKYAHTLTDETASSVLLDGARANDTALIIRLLSLPHKIPVNTTDYYYGFPGWTALHHAASYANAEVVARLLSAGAPANAVTEAGETAMILCQKNVFRRSVSAKQRGDCVRLLEAAGAMFPVNTGIVGRWLLRRGIVW